MCKTECLFVIAHAAARQAPVESVCHQWERPTASESAQLNPIPGIARKGGLDAPPYLFRCSSSGSGRCSLAMVLNVGFGSLSSVIAGVLVMTVG